MSPLSQASGAATQRLLFVRRSVCSLFPSVCETAISTPPSPWAIPVSRAPSRSSPDGSSCASAHHAGNLGKFELTHFQKLIAIWSGDGFKRWPSTSVGEGIARTPVRLIRLDAGPLDNRPPSVDFLGLEFCQEFRRLLLGRINVLADLGKTPLHAGIGERGH